MGHKFAGALIAFVHYVLFVRSAMDDDNNPALLQLGSNAAKWPSFPALHHPIITILATFPTAEQGGHEVI